jgi:Putative transposase/Transposase zinc-binding domain
MSTRPATGLEVADVVRLHGPAFLAEHGPHLHSGQRRLLRDLVRCRTAALGGHVEACADCGVERIAYNSCRNRHCPKCQGACRARWLTRETSFLLPVEYHHVVFTLPATLGPLALANPRRLYDLLFQAARDSVLEVAADPRFLGAMPGLLLVLHTWGQSLQHHPHVHGVVTGGGLSCDVDGQVDAEPCWRSCRPGFFLPVRVLSRVFRGKYLCGLRRLAEQERLHWPAALRHLADAVCWSRWLTPLYQQEWVVYAKPPFGGPEQVLKYLARYTHRVAISNARLLECTPGPDGAAEAGPATAGQVTFRYKDYADEHKGKTMTLRASEFLRRFVQHVLPKGFVKLRHYGLLANRRRQQHLHVARRLLLGAGIVDALAAAASAHSVERPAPVCAACQSPRVRLKRLCPLRPCVVEDSS